MTFALPVLTAIAPADFDLPADAALLDGPAGDLPLGATRLGVVFLEAGGEDLGIGFEVDATMVDLALNRVRRLVLKIEDK